MSLSILMVFILGLIIGTLLFPTFFRGTVIDKKLTDIVPSNKTCAVTTCHGLDVQCGEISEPTNCTQVYMLGDSCLSLAKCAYIEGTCQFTPSVEFAQCKEQVQSCVTQFPEDPEKQMNCASQQ